MEDKSSIEYFFQGPGPCPPRRSRKGILSRAGTTQCLLPGKLHSRITRYINRPAGNEASGVRGKRRDKRRATRGHRVWCAQQIKWSTHRSLKEKRKSNKGNTLSGLYSKVFRPAIKHRAVLSLAAAAVHTALRWMTDLFGCSGTSLSFQQKQ